MDFRARGRGRGREKHQCLPRVPIANPRYREWNHWQSFGAQDDTQPTEPHGQAQFDLFLKIYVFYLKGL